MRARIGSPAPTHALHCALSSERRCVRADFPAPARAPPPRSGLRAQVRRQPPPARALDLRSGLRAQEPRQFTLDDINMMTQNFENFCGSGQFAKVYRGRFCNEEIAVKVYTEENKAKAMLHPCFIRERSEEASSEVANDLRLYSNSKGELVFLLFWSRQAPQQLTSKVSYVLCGRCSLKFGLVAHSDDVDDKGMASRCDDIRAKWSKVFGRGLVEVVRAGARVGSPAPACALWHCTLALRSGLRVQGARASAAPHLRARSGTALWTQSAGARARADFPAPARALAPRSRLRARARRLPRTCAPSGTALWTQSAGILDLDFPYSLLLEILFGDKQELKFGGVDNRCVIGENQEIEVQARATARARVRPDCPVPEDVCPDPQARATAREKARVRSHPVARPTARLVARASPLAPAPLLTFELARSTARRVARPIRSRPRSFPTLARCDPQCEQGRDRARVAPWCSVLRTLSCPLPYICWG
ncbi:hypothetical protein C2S51_037998 [Perilla frutescens var. frutescens]|nr:hypothetical protein C2S51_037998 [Perilla frutescens var. frutescens]